jgi:hypothetical protein
MRANVRTSLAAALTAAGLLSAAACGGGGGGGGGGRPSTSEIAKALGDGDNSLLGSTGDNLGKSAENCIAKALHDSKISDAGLRALVRKDKNYKPSSGDSKAAASAADDMAKCIAPSS